MLYDNVSQAFIFGKYSDLQRLLSHDPNRAFFQIWVILSKYDQMFPVVNDWPLKGMPTVLKWNEWNTFWLRHWSLGMDT